jgi:hypothetical protein
MNSKRNPLIALLAIALLSLFALSACGALGDVIGSGIEGSGVIVTREFDFSDFNEVELRHAFQGAISRGDTYSVVVRIDDNLVDRLQVEQTGNRIVIGLDQTTLTGQATLEVDVTLPALTWLSASGASTAQLNGFASADDFTGHASGASRIHGDIAAGDLDLEASGASTISLAGTAGDVRANASGASTIDLEELTAANADAEASGASTVIVNLNGTLDADASGASNIHYLGDVTLGNIQESGGSDVDPR